MYATQEQVKELTGYDVDLPTLHMAQGIIEAFTGRPEALVEEPRDIAVLSQATAYQAAYMTHNGELAFEQVALSQIGHYGSIQSYKPGDFTAPWIAPLAVIACRHVSWRRPRSVKTGSIFGRHVEVSWERD